MATAKLSLSFRIFKNGQLIREEKLDHSVIKIGKVPSAHLRIDDETVSRMHAVIEVVGSEVGVIDLGSTRGTFVNGHRINKANLQTGDSITVGDSRIELVIDEAVATVAVAAPVRAPDITPVVPVRPPPPVRTAPANGTYAAAVTLPVATATLPFATPASPAMFQASMASIDEGGARAVEVAAMLGDSVVGVKHCMDPRSGKVTAATWGFAAGGLACLIASATAFYTSVDIAAQNKAALQAHTQMGKPVRGFRPERVSPALDALALGGLAAGLIGLTAALARVRRERKSPFYRIGTAPEVEQPIENAPAASFPLVAPSGDDFVFNYGAGMDGELIVDGKSTPLCELAAQGRARPSPTTAGAIEVPIPMKSRIRARAGQTTFLVSAVARPNEVSTPLFNVERRTLVYAVGSLAVHLGIVAFLSMIPVEGSGVNVELGLEADTSLRASMSAMIEVPPELKDKESGDDPGQESTSTKMALDEGTAGKPTAERVVGRMEVKNNNVEPRLARDAAIRYAQEAGVLGSVSVLRGGITALTATDPFSSGIDVGDIYGPLFGSQGEGRGNFGQGRNGWGAGGGCTQEPCGIIHGVARYETIGTGDRAGDGYRGGGSWGNGGKRTAAVPQPVIGRATTAGGLLDKAIIKRYIKRSLHKIAYCYESELMARPGIEGSVMVHFLITGSGTVQSSNGVGFDGSVSSCVAAVIKNIEFPRPTDGGSVQVNYPFTFHAAGR